MQYSSIKSKDISVTLIGLYCLWLVRL